MKNVTMRMLATGAALGAALLLNAPANAQDQAPRDRGGWSQRQRPDPGQRLDRQVAMLTQRLRLSDTQASQIRAILRQEGEQMQAWRQQHAGERRAGGQGGWQRGGQDGQRGERQPGQRPQLPPELQAIRDRSEQRIERVLNAGQRAQYQQLRGERQQRGGERGLGRGQRADSR